MLQTVMVWCLLATLLASASAQDATAEEFLRAYESGLPKPEELSWYSLDWAPTLKEAKERAAKEGRPILGLHTNGRGNLWGGFC